MGCSICDNPIIYAKKIMLCQYCYNKERRKSINSGKHLVKEHPIYGRELTFLKNFFDHKNWIHHPATFHLDDSDYSPDFYDGERNTFIEVSGTRQAFSANLDKYKEFKRNFPSINFEVRKIDGTLISELDDIVNWQLKEVSTIKVNL